MLSKMHGTIIKKVWKYYLFFLIVVFPCMLIITQLLFQQNALVLLLKAQNITICTFVFVFIVSF
jgi:hypothetical protein